MRNVLALAAFLAMAASAKPRVKPVPRGLIPPMNPPVSPSADTPTPIHGTEGHILGDPIWALIQTQPRFEVLAMSRNADLLRREAVVRLDEWRESGCRETVAYLIKAGVELV